jgi:hypothetical protein
MCRKGEDDEDEESEFETLRSPFLFERVPG